MPSEFNYADRAIAPLPRRSRGGLSNPARFPESDDRLSSRRDGTSLTRFSSSFNFNVLVPQRNEDANNPQQRPYSGMSRAESRRVGDGYSLQTTMPKASHRSRIPADHDGTTHGLNQPIVSQRSNVQQESSVSSFLRHDGDSTTAHTRSVEHEGSSPTLRVVANRLHREPSIHSRGMLCFSRGLTSDTIFQKPPVVISQGTVWTPLIHSRLRECPHLSACHTTPKGGTPPGPPRAVVAGRLVRYLHPSKVLFRVERKY